MSALIDPARSTVALTPEQQAVAAMWGGGLTVLAARLSMRIVIMGPLDRERLRTAVNGVLDAHAALGCAFGTVSGFRGLRQQFDASQPERRWHEADFSSAPDQQVALDAWLQAWCRLPAGQAMEALLDVGLARLDASRHVLALAVSPLAADRGSLRTLFEQFAAAFHGGSGEGVASNPDALFQYDQFAAWRQEIEEDEEAATGRDYWRRYLDAAGLPAAPRLAIRENLDEESGAEAGRLVHVVAHTLDPVLTARIAALAQAEQTTPALVCQAAWWLTLARLTGLQTFTAGWQHDCRDDYDVMQGGVGVFDKVLPVVVDVTGADSGRSWLRRLSSVAAGHVDAQEYFPVHAPATQDHLACGFMAATHPEIDPGIGWRLEALPGAMPCFELALAVEWAVDGAQAGAHTGTQLKLRADAARYAHAAAERLLQQYVTLLQGLAEEPDAAVTALPMVGGIERAALLANQGMRLDIGNLTLGEHVARWAEVTPQAIAIEAGERRLDYREFDRQANRLARWLASRGVRAGTLVALDLPRSPELLVAILGVWRAGAAYVPLEPDWPQARRDAVLRDARPVLRLHAQVGQEGADGDAGVPSAAWNTIDFAALDDTPPATAAALDDLAYVLYTSGSTGKPKGVMIAQRHLLNYVAAATQAMNLHTCRRWALTSSVVADLGNTALFGAFYSGACLVVAGRSDMEDGAAFARFMFTHGIDALKIVPSHLEALLETETPRLPRVLVLGGEAVPRAFAERLAAIRPDAVIYNHYGPTETTVGVMVHRFVPGARTGETLPLTTVLANSRVYVLDEMLRPAPTGALGEVFIGGAQVCRGYLEREDGGAFVADPFDSAARLYRTGDLAHALPGGGLRLAGRADHQLKIRGFRVEPAEIEAALLSLPGVRQAAVLPHERAGGTELAAFVMAEPVPADGGRALRAALADQLPDHMVPAGYVFVDAFPRLPNGKIDRLALLSSLDSSGGHRGQAAAEDSPPEDDVAFLLAACMGELLGRAPLAAGDDFFDFGAHSMMVIKLVARIRKLLKVEVAPALVFDHPSAAELAAALREAAADPESVERLARDFRHAAPSPAADLAMAGS